MTGKVLIRGGTVVTAEGRYAADIAVVDGRIAAIGAGLATEGDVIDASGTWVMPGGVDPHCHIEQVSGMGLRNADTWESATRSAARGGTTSVIAFAAQAKGERLRDTVADYSGRAGRGAMIDYAFHLSVCDPEVPDFAEDLAALIETGHRSIKVFTTYNIKLSDRDILDILTVARRHGALTCVHAENDGMIGWTKSALLAGGHVAPKYHAPSHPRLAEVEAVERIARFAEFLGAPVMLFHISTAEGAAAVRAARGRGAPIWAETCPHYLLMTEDVLNRPDVEGAKWMCSPPQRNSSDQAALWHALSLGDLALVSSDHAPYRYDASGKLSAGPEPSFDKIANGLPGLETRLPLLFDALAHQPGGAERFVALTATAPALVYGLPGKGVIRPGADADLVLWDPNRTHTYGANDLADNVGYNPWEGRRVRGWPVHVLRRGETVMQDGEVLASPGSGAWMARPDGPAVANPAPEAALAMGIVTSSGSTA